MKGLLKKDFYLIWRNCRSILLVAALFIAMSAFGSTSMFIIMYPMVFAGTLPVSLLGYDESSRWSSYCDALPCTRAQVVSAKYTVSLLCIAVVFVLSALTQILRLSIAGGTLDSIGFLLLDLLLVGLIAPAICLPAVFKFGAEKGRIVFYFVFGGVCVFSLMVVSSSPFLNLPMPALAAGAVALFALSWLLSVSFYQKRSL